MLLNDSTKMAMGAISSQRVRSFLTALGIAVGIASVVLLTSIGEGIRQAKPLPPVCQAQLSAMCDL